MNFNRQTSQPSYGLPHKSDTESQGVNRMQQSQNYNNQAPVTSMEMKNETNDRQESVEGFYDTHRMTMHGPLVLRLFAILGMLCLLGVSIFNMFNLSELINQINTFVLHIYLAFFSVCMSLVELKGVSHADHGCLHPWRNHLEQWAKFLTVLGGRGGTYIFVGVLSITLWGLADIIIGAYILLIGIVCCTVHCALVRQLKNQENSPETQELNPNEYEPDNYNT
eukprot:GHVR01080524.1.p1 GENE.GHVR01080524.1~~GHVR01080524.1.p1  ORF type:complete len:223 (+),score=21.92 GHVR01080524.1:557-1225(+)